MAAAKIKEMWNVGDCVRFHAQNTPDKVSTVYEDRVTTFAELDRLSNQVANGLLALGIEPGDHVAYFGKNSDHHVQWKAGINKVRAILTPVNWRLAAPEVEYVLQHSDSKVLLVSPEYAPLVAKIADKLPELSTVLVAEEPWGDWQQFEAWRDAQDDSDPGIQCWLDDVDVQLYTSGTTGRPKGVMFSNATTFLGWTGHVPDPNDPEIVGTWKAFDPDETSLCIAPNFHLSGNGSITTALRMGTTVVIHPEFDIAKVVHDILHYKTSKIFMVPAVLQILLDKAKQGADLSAINLISYGASPIPPELMRAAVEVIGCGFLQMYGMTEIGGSATFLEPEDHTLTPTERMKSAGKPGDFHEIKIVDPTTREELPRRTSGEIAIRTAAPMSGYYNNPEATAEVLDSEGWYYSGDMGMMDEEDYVYIQDRLKDMIVSGGENIYSAEVENALGDHPGIREVAIIGVPSQRWGEEVKALVVLEEGESLSQDDIIMFAREQIAGYKVPKSVEFRDELPRNGSGKLLKHVLREPYWEGQERRVG